MSIIKRYATEDYVESEIDKINEAIENKTSEVYIGSDEPIDPNVTVWINPEGKPAHEDELNFIKTITITAEQAGAMEIVETFEPGYDVLIVTATSINKSTSTKQIYAGVGESYMTRGCGGGIGKNNVVRFVFRKLYGTWEIYGFTGGDSSCSTMIGQVSAQNISSTKEKPGFSGVAFNKIKYFKFYTFDEDGFPEGATVNIYAV